MDTTTGTLSYTVALTGEPFPGQRNQLNLFYAKSGNNIDLLGINGVSINVTSLSGMGELLVGLNGVGEGISVQLTAPGLVYIPFSNTSPRLPEGRSTLVLSVIAKSVNFSATPDETSAVPEPSAPRLPGAGGSWWLAHRPRS